MDDEFGLEELDLDTEKTRDKHADFYPCDRCGSEMVARNCKLVCLNCGNRFDCSDLTLVFD